MRRIESGSQFLFAYFHIVLPYIINLIMLSLLSITKCVMTLQLDNLWTDKNLERHFVWMLDILYHEWLIILTLFLQITLGVFSSLKQNTSQYVRLDLCSVEIVQHLEPSLLSMISSFHINSPFRCIYRAKALLTSNFTFLKCILQLKSQGQQSDKGQLVSWN